MTKEIKVGDETLVFGASAELPILYRELTGREIFADSRLMQDESSILFDLAWVMFRDGNPDSTIGEKEWLRQFGFMDMNEALGEIVELYTGSQATTSKAKKNNET